MYIITKETCLRALRVDQEEKPRHLFALFSYSHKIYEKNCVITFYMKCYIMQLCKS